MFVLLLAVQTVLADNFFTGKPAVLHAVCKNNTYVESTAKITILDPDNNIIVNNETMTIISLGKFNHSFIPTIEGSHLSYVFCNISNVIGVAEESFFVLEELEMIATEIGLFGNIVISILVFIIHFVLVIIGFAFRTEEIAFVGGVFGVIAGLVSLALLSSFLNVVGMGFFVAYIVVSMIFMFGISKNRE